MCSHKPTKFMHVGVWQCYIPHYGMGQRVECGYATCPQFRMSTDVNYYDSEKRSYTWQIG